MSRKNVDLDVLVKDFIDLYKVVDSITKENDQMKEEMKISDKRMYCYGVSEQNSKEEIANLQSIVRNYQKMLVDYDQIKEQNNDLKCSLDKLTDAKKSLEQELVSNKDNNMQQFHDVQEAHKKEIQRVQQQAHELASNEISIYESKLCESMKDISFLKRDINDMEKKYQSELVQVKLQYDFKIQKLQQRQLAQANTSAGSMSARNDIFRKKLQHLQIESEKELKELRSKCTEQQEEITGQQHQFKLQKKKLQDQYKQQQDQVRQQEQVIRQSQTEIRRLQAMLKQEKDSVTMLQNDMVTLQNTFEEQHQHQQASVPKRRRSMFNPNNNRLGGPL